MRTGLLKAELKTFILLTYTKLAEQQVLNLPGGKFTGCVMYCYMSALHCTINK